jgi:hypothetical protein
MKANHCQALSELGSELASELLAEMLGSADEATVVGVGGGSAIGSSPEGARPVFMKPSFL